MIFEKFDFPSKTLYRVIGEEESEYNGPVQGIKIQPSENTDPLWIEFDEHFYVQDFCKTQFADVEVHVKIVELLRRIEFCFEYLNVEDEGEYWQTENKENLQQLIDDCFNAIEEAVKENQNLTGPYRLQDGRITDLMEP